MATFSPGIGPKVTLHEELSLETVRRFVLESKPEVAAECAVKLKRDNQLLRAALYGLANELSRTSW